MDKRKRKGQTKSIREKGSKGRDGKGVQGDEMLVRHVDWAVTIEACVLNEMDIRHLLVHQRK